MMQNLKNDRNPGIQVFIGECSARAIQWKPTWQDLDGFPKSLRSCALDLSSLKILHICRKVPSKCCSQVSTQNIHSLKNAELCSSYRIPSKTCKIYIPLHCRNVPSRSQRRRFLEWYHNNKDGATLLIKWAIWACPCWGGRENQEVDQSREWVVVKVIAMARWDCGENIELAQLAVLPRSSISTYWGWTTLPKQAYCAIRAITVSKGTGSFWN